MIIAENLQNYDDNNNDEILYPLTGRYLHGELEDINGYDICYCNDKEELNIINTPGIHNVSVDVFGNILKCVAYIWSDKYTTIKGLIVLKDNEEDNQYALSKYEERALVL